VHLFLLASLVTALVAGCAENVANTCPGTTVPRCLTGLSCAEDPNRGCQICQCKPPAYVPLEAAPVGGPPPPPPQ
jgi:hypothetical protein